MKYLLLILLAGCCKEPEYRRIGLDNDGRMIVIDCICATGFRNVPADTTGFLSAPVTDKKQK